MHRIWLTTAALLLASGVAQIPSSPCEELPKSMRKISTRVIEPKMDPGSFAAQPKVAWRAGNRYARIAEAPDPGARIYVLSIINEPDVWLINLYDKSGKHILDTGPTTNAHIPIFPPAWGVAEFKELEFGREVLFFTKSHAARSEGEVIKGAATERNKVTVGSASAILWTGLKSKAPVRISLTNGEQTMTIDYLVYEDLPFDASLFQPPPGIRIQNSPQM